MEISTFISRLRFRDYVIGLLVLLASLYSHGSAATLAIFCYTVMLWYSQSLDECVDGLKKIEKELRENELRR